MTYKDAGQASKDHKVIFLIDASRLTSLMLRSRLSMTCVCFCYVTCYVTKIGYIKKAAGEHAARFLGLPI